MQASLNQKKEGRHPWLLADNLGGDGRQGAGRARTNSGNFHVEQKPCFLLFCLIESLTSGTEEWLARAGFFSCNMILVFSIIFLVFRNNIHQQTLDSSKLCLSEVCHFHPILHSPPSETLHSEKLDLTEICRFRTLMSSPLLSSFYFLSCPPVGTCAPL